MNYYEKTIIPVIESKYESFSNVEKNIADFFISNSTEMDFSSKNISGLLFVSEASLSRFAKKCGFKGYREFLYEYKSSFGEKNPNITNQTRTVFDAYQELINKSYNLISHSQVERIVAILSRSRRVFVYGKGSSGLAAREMQLRFMRIGVDIDAIDDSDVMRMNSVMANASSFVIGISISGKTSEITESLQRAHKNGAVTMLITASSRKEYKEFCDEILYVSVRKHLDYGNFISPQFPILVMIDILYAYFQQEDQKHKAALYIDTLTALKREVDDI